VFVLLCLQGCSDDVFGGREEGVIEFATRAVDPSHPLYGFAPDAATLKYKKDRFSIEMSTMGMFNYAIIGDNKEKTLAQTIKFMNIKQACIERGKEIDEDNLDYALNLEETGETKEIVGLKCYKVKVSRANDPSAKWDAWYTKELGVENCNALTPYAKIKGMLLDYRIKKMGMEMHFLAKSHKNIQVPDNTFKIPATMKIIPKEEMEQFFRELQ
jgi:hypothetical protein